RGRLAHLSFGELSCRSRKEGYRHATVRGQGETSWPTFCSAQEGPDARLLSPVSAIGRGVARPAHSIRVPVRVALVPGPGGGDDVFELGKFRFPAQVA